MQLTDIAVTKQRSVASFFARSRDVPQVGILRDQKVTAKLLKAFPVTWADSVECKLESFRVHHEHPLHDETRET